MKTKINGIPDVPQFKKLLKDKGLRATPQRVAVHEAMLALGHAGADGVASWLSERGSVRVSSASVYNILSDMADLRIYGRRSSRSGKMVYDVRPGGNIHLYDTRNDEYRDVEDDELAALVEKNLKTRRFRGYKIDGVEIQILCHPTRRKKTLPVGK